jgi:cytochrome c553
MIAAARVLRLHVVGAVARWPAGGTRGGMRNIHRLILGALAAAFATWLAAHGACAQSQPAGLHEELRPLAATPMEVAEGQRLAQRFCADCHGPLGITTIAGVPNLAGQRGPYLYMEMRAFRSGARGSDTMNGAITYLTPSAMSNVAAYYASLDPAEPSSLARARSEVDPVQAGKAAAAACVGCHGMNGVSHIPGIPSLVGQQPKYLARAMAAYKTGERKNDTMKAMVAALPASTADDIALYYAFQKVEPAATPVAGNAAAGQALSAPCASCHGADGVSNNPATPSLAGQDAQYLAAALLAYKRGARANATMKALVATLDDGAMRNLAAYFAGRTPLSPDVKRPLNAAEWSERCDRCHGVNGNSTDPRIPALAGQNQAYLSRVLNAYRSGARRSAVMTAMMGGLSDNDIRNLAAYYASRKARSVVYVQIPNR